MVLERFIRTILVITVFILISVLFSCEEIIIIDCTECVTNEPSDALLEIQLEENPQGALITIYQGNMEDNIILRQFTSFSKVAYQEVPFNKSYTLTAEYTLDKIVYTQDEKVYVAVNTVQPRVKYVEEKCTDPCYYTYDQKVNLRLKYY
jgi:hypothetical protein